MNLHPPSRSPAFPLLLICALAAVLTPARARASSDSWLTAVVISEASGIDERTVKTLGAAAVEACGGTALRVQRTVEETDVVLRTAGLNPRSCATDVSCLIALGRAAGVRYLVAIGASRIAEEIALTVDIVDTTWERAVGHGERTVTGGVHWTELMAEVVVQALPVSMRRPTGTLAVSANVEGAAVLLDGRRIGATPLPAVFIGPGRYEVVVQHPDFPEFRRRIEMEPGSELRVDALLIKPPPPPPEKPFWTPRRVGAAAAGGAALVGLATGIGFTFSASDAESEYYRVCGEHSGAPCRPNKPLTRGETPRMKELRSDAETSSILANVGFIGAAVAAAGSAVLITLDLLDQGSPVQSDEPDASLAAGPIPGGGALVLTGTF